MAHSSKSRGLSAIVAIIIKSRSDVKFDVFAIIRKIYSATCASKSLRNVTKVMLDVGGSLVGWLPIVWGGRDREA